MSAVLPSPAAAGARSTSVDAAWRRPPVLRAVLWVGLLAVMVLAAAVASRSAHSAVEPELVLLLRAMAVIKAGIALVAVALCLWRLGGPVSTSAAVGYLLGVWSLGGATVLIGFVSFIPAAAVIFHVALFGLLALAWREGRFAPRMRVVRPFIVGRH